MRVPAHPRLSVNSISSFQQSLRDDLALWRDLGIGHVGLILPKIEADGWETARDLVTGAALRVSTVFGPSYRPLDADPAHGWQEADRAATVRALEFAASIGAGSVYGCSGAAASLAWEEAADAYCAFIAPCAARAAELGVPLLVEPTNPLRVDLGFVFSVRDAMDLARRAGIQVVLDVQSCWLERGLADLVRKHVDLVGLVQISDYVIGTLRTGERVVPGDGHIPLERLLGMLLDAGYAGAFDLEIMGPRIEAEGYRSAIRRSVERASELLDRLGA
jgi:sugar phosphate isomerase/epimerase